MGRFRRTTALSLLWFIIVLSHQILWAVGDGGGGQYGSPHEEEKPSLAKILTETISLLRKSHKSYWERVKRVIHEMQLQFSPPSLDFRGTNEADHVAGKKLQEAAKKSIGKSKMAVEESAKSAAEVVGEAVHMTAEKIKEAVSDTEEGHDEL